MFPSLSLPFSPSLSLGYFIEKCEELQRKRDLLDAVQKLLNIPLSPYPELEHTQEVLCTHTCNNLLAFIYLGIVIFENIIQQLSRFYTF